MRSLKGASTRSLPRYWETRRPHHCGIVLRPVEKAGSIHMEQILINLLAGVLGGVGVGKSQLGAVHTWHKANIRRRRWCPLLG
jgi:hypothetical protein